MKKPAILLTIFTFIVIIFTISGCKIEKKEKEQFSIAFITDIHLQTDQNAVQGLTQALDTINKLKPDFILTGGDLIMDAIDQKFSHADSLYNLYSSVIKRSECPVYNTMGNHEIYGIGKNSGADPLGQEYGEKMFEKRLGKSYYAFEHKGWKFMILNSIEDTRKGGYVGKIDSAQIVWIKDELKKTAPATPIVLSTHIPLITANTQKYEGSTVASDSSFVVYNSKEVIDMFRGYNLKLVLQGHLHTYEDIFIDNIHFITGGAISAAWWGGPNQGCEEGFMHIKFTATDFTSRYVDYGWNVVK
jgi:3',5'-cyclic AMP phosphodiesterase CpdA